MKLHASTDDNGVTRFMIEHEDGSRTTFQAFVVDAELDITRDFDTVFDRGFGHRYPRMSQSEFSVTVSVIGEVTRTAAPWRGPSADMVIVDECVQSEPKELPGGE